MSDPNPETSTPTTPPTATEAAPAEAAEEPAKKTLTSVKSLGISHDRNARFRRTMEDAHTFVDGFGGNPKTGYFGIYDGHGGRGAVEFVQAHLHENLLAELEKDPKDVAGAFGRSFVLTDDQIEENKIQYSGTTVISVLIREEEEGVKRLYSANVGDARTVLCRGGQAMRITRDHKGTDEDEIARIQAAGGFVVVGRVNGILAVTRSLGDRAMKRYVTGDPYTEDHTLTEEDTHVILACDGVWDVISDQQACDIVLAAGSCGEASKELLVTALRSGSTDNISVMVVRI